MRMYAIRIYNLTAVRKTKGTATEYDMSIGQRVRMQRSLLGWSQEKLANALGITFQQIQKYENGDNRIAAGRLYEIAKIMGVNVSSFYADILTHAFADNDQESLSAPNPLSNKETVELIQAYYSLKTPASRKQFVQLAKGIADNLRKSS